MGNLPEVLRRLLLASIYIAGSILIFRAIMDGYDNQVANRISPFHTYYNRMVSSYSNAAGLLIALPIAHKLINWILHRNANPLEDSRLYWTLLKNANPLEVSRRILLASMYIAAPIYSASAAWNGYKVWKMSTTQTGEYIIIGSGYVVKRADVFSSMVVWFVVAAALLIALPFAHKLINWILHRNAILLELLRRLLLASTYIVVLFFSTAMATRGYVKFKKYFEMESADYHFEPLKSSTFEDMGYRFGIAVALLIALPVAHKLINWILLKD